MEDVSDWLEDRPGFDYGPRWKGDLGIREEDKKRRQDISDMLADVVVTDPDLENLMPKLAPPPAPSRGRRRHRKKK